MARARILLCLALVSACSSAASTEPATAPATTAAPTDPAPTAAVPTETPPPAAPPVDVSAKVLAFDQALASAVCAQLDTCCSDADRSIYFGRFHDKPYELTSPPPRATCAQDLAAALQKLHTKWAKSANRGRIAFDEPRGKVCIDSVRAAACGVPLATVLGEDACFGARGNEVFRKITPLGGACEDIADGTFYGECDPKLGFCGSSKTCEAWSQPGEPCSVVPTRKFCAPQLACDNVTASKPGVCSPPPVTKKLGEGCGADTGALELCETGTYCDYVTLKCLPQKADGVSCTQDDECASFHPFTCAPLGKGTCGSTSFCAGGGK